MTQTCFKRHFLLKLMALGKTLTLSIHVVSQKVLTCYWIFRYADKVFSYLRETEVSINSSELPIFLLLTISWKDLRLFPVEIDWFTIGNLYKRTDPPFNVPWEHCWASGKNVAEGDVLFSGKTFQNIDGTHFLKFVEMQTYQRPKCRAEPFICLPNLKIHLGIRATRALLFLCCLP